MQIKIPTVNFIKPTYLISFLLTLAFTLSLSKITFAQVVINEFDILASPQAVELYNTSSQTVDVNGWHLDDSGGSTFLTLANQSPLQPLTCMVVKGSLNLNTASPDTIRLFDNTSPPTSATAQLVDSYAYTQSPPAGSSYARSPDGSGAFTILTSSLGVLNDSRTDCTAFSPTPTITSSPIVTPTNTWTPTPIPSLTPTTTVPTITPSFTETPTPIPHIYISEVMVNPSTGYEWVELYNDATDSYVLSNWYIDDLIDGGSSPIRVNTIVPAHGRIAIDIPSPIFNNSGDSIRLIDPAGREVEIFMYNSSQIDVSWGRESIYSDILCEQTPSKGSENNLCLDQVDETITTPSPSPQPTTSTTPLNVYLSELYVNPNAGEREWLELYNDNRYSVVLTGWKVRDAANQTIASLTVTLDAYRYAVIELTSDKMNNTNEEIVLLYPSGEVADRFTYDNSEKGISWGRSPSDFSQWCFQNPSPDRFNYSCIPQPTATLTPTLDPTRSPTPTKTKTPTPTTRLSLGNQQSSGGDSNRGGDVLGTATSRVSSGTNNETLNYTPQQSEVDDDGDSPAIYSNGLIEQSVSSSSGSVSELFLYLFMLSLCMMVGGFQTSKLWNLYHESNLAYPDMFG